MPFIGAFALILLGVISGTLAYYTSGDNFTNEFNTGEYVIETTETFVSPDNWLPGDTTSKEVVVTNRGTVDDYWNSLGFITLWSSSTFKMPDHGVIFETGAYEE